MSAASFTERTCSNPYVDRHGVVHVQEECGLQCTAEKVTDSEPSINKVLQFVAHDLRHHLSVIYPNAELLFDKKSADFDREDMLADIRTAIVSMTDILDSALVHSRTGCMVKLRLEPLKVMIDKAVQMILSHPNADQINLIYETVPLIEVYADSRWLCSAIFNLLLNACQATRLAPESKEVRIICHEDKSNVFIRVADRGRGVPEEIQNRLSQHFLGLQLEATGLGLTIVRSIAREHGGELYLEESKSEGSIFVLRLPKPDANRTDCFRRKAIRLPLKK